MCGISGIFSTGGPPVREDDIWLMVDALAHRGPNDEGVFSDRKIGLGHRRLSIFDLSQAGHQPMRSADGRYWIVHNGEVYNWPEIREKLSFDGWRTGTDTEVILEAFAERGPACLDLFNGMYAFAIWDTKEQNLFLARDRVGIKPILYGWHNGCFYFASEVKALFAAGFPKGTNENAVYDFLRWGSIDHNDETLFEGIKQVPQGHWMRLTADGAVELQAYWDIANIVHKNEVVESADAIRLYDELLRDSISLRTRGDVPIGAFLSGGIDSSIIVSQLVQSGISNLCALTYDFDTGDAGERAFAQEVTSCLGIEHDFACLSHAEVPEYFNKVLFHQESPITSLRVLAAHKLYELCRNKGLTVILEGMGGDQIGAGFEYYWMAAVMDVATNEGPEKASQLVNSFMAYYGVPEAQKYDRLIHAMTAIVAQGTATQDGRTFVKPQLLDRNFRSCHRDRSLSLARPFESHLLNVQYNDFHGGNLMRVLRYTDRASMSVGCEARVPILDHNIVELAFCSEPQARIHETEQRYFMREAAKGLLPPELLSRPKRSVVDPQRLWLKNELRPWVADILGSSSFRELGYFDTEAVRAEYDAYCAHDGLPPSGFHIFQYVNIALWQELIIKGDLLSTPTAKSGERRESVADSNFGVRIK